MWNPPRTSNLEHHSPSEDKMSPTSLVDDIERGKNLSVYNVSLEEVSNIK